ncbi:MAG: SIS domain-containing protein [Pseudomonadota bacterium]
MSFKNYCKTVSDNFQHLHNLSDEIEKASNLLIDVISKNGKIMFCGNGGSAADSQHLATELSGRYLKERPAIAAIALSVDTSALTAIGNDYGYQYVFSRQLQAIGHKNDALIAISTSGNSANVIEACKLAKKIDIHIITLTGQTGGKLANLADIALCVPSKQTNHIQEMHIAVGHYLCAKLEDWKVLNS